MTHKDDGNAGQKTNGTGGSGGGDSSGRGGESGQSGTIAARLIEVTLDEKSVANVNPNARHEREVAIFDLIDDNFFALEPRDGTPREGPYRLHLAIAEDRLVFDVTCAGNDLVYTYMLSLSPLRRIIKDYFLVCDSYYQAIRTAAPSRIEAIDMGRRGLHDDGSKLLTERLKGKITVDFDTARRLFTLICALHWKG